MRCPHPVLPLAGAALVLGLWLSAGRAHAQQGVSPPVTTGPVPILDQEPDPEAAPASASQPGWRPRMSLAVGFGASLDPTGFANGPRAIPAFFGVGGFGDGLGGFDLGAFSSAATGRFHAGDDAPVDRLALDAFGVLRPFARVGSDAVGYGVRVLRTLGVEVGLGFERDGRTSGSGTRFLIHTGGRIELPLTPAGRASELRLRLAFRRAIGLYKPQVSGAATGAPVTIIGDSTEVYAALAVIF